MKLFYFTSTGNSLYVSKKILENSPKGELFKINEKRKKVVINEDKIGIIYPLHVFGLPIIVEDFIKNLEFKNKPYIFVVQVTGGGTSNNGFFKINEILKEKGLEINNYEEIKYISNYTRMGRNPTKERALKEIENENEKLENFIKDINKNKIKIFNNKKNKITDIIHNIWKDKYKNKDRNFFVDDNCIGCGICEKICPVNNIYLKNGKPEFLNKCIDCMGCINICERKSINIKNKTKNKNRYRNPYIKIEELIK